ncbi:MAG: ABC transporter ATP-binding protein, partial [Flavobacteriia bacterium]|nr:ABC transporter ATP-binding protein [Flavobacteriia bacterium]
MTFEVSPGESVGILGKNGAGKSTLLQIIAGTLSQTDGVVHTDGRITALLELGSGFNPDFTGRENVLLNAQIMGLSHGQVAEKFDDIVSFADIGDFINHPVKTYSSGMMVRLAFAVQTAFDPKILIVDEALAVGDMFFQSKCIARIKKLIDDGVTLLFVSHDPGTVRQLCNRAVLLENGEMVCFGDAKSVADRYAASQLDERNRESIARLKERKSIGHSQTLDMVTSDSINRVDIPGIDRLAGTVGLQKDPIILPHGSLLTESGAEQSVPKSTEENPPDSSEKADGEKKSKVKKISNDPDIFPNWPVGKRIINKKPEVFLGKDNLR